MTCGRLAAAVTCSGGRGLPALHQFMLLCKSLLLPECMMMSSCADVYVECVYNLWSPMEQFFRRRPWVPRPRGCSCMRSGARVSTAFHRHEQPGRTLPCRPRLAQGLIARCLRDAWLPVHVERFVTTEFLAGTIVSEHSNGGCRCLKSAAPKKQCLLACSDSSLTSLKLSPAVPTGDAAGAVCRRRPHRVPQAPAWKI